MAEVTAKHSNKVNRLRFIHDGLDGLRRNIRRSAVTLAGLVAVLTPLAALAADWPYTPANRWQAIAEMQTLNAEILGSKSATFSLEHWCEAHHLADSPRLIADLVTDAQIKPVSAEQRQRLGLSDTEPVKYRRVRLRCGDHVLSEADNWYVPSRLTPEMNHTLETTDVPFGRAIKDLAPYRLTFEAKVLWTPSAKPEGVTLAIGQELFEHRAVLYRSADHLPFSEVDEHYQAAILDFPPAE